MDANELSKQFGELTGRAIKEGVHAGKLDYLQVIGLLEIQKNEVLRVMHAQAMMKMQRERSRIVIAGGPLPRPK